MSDKKPYRDVIARFKDEVPKGCCYRCWQVGKTTTPATLGVVFNRRTEHEWSAPSCATCFAKDRGAYGRNNVAIVLALVGVGKQTIK